MLAYTTENRKDVLGSIDRDGELQKAFARVEEEGRGKGLFEKQAGFIRRASETPRVSDWRRGLRAMAEQKNSPAEGGGKKWVKVLDAAENKYWARQADLTREMGERFPAGGKP